jgi:hypothetical protein
MIQLVTLMLVRILFKIIGICDHWSKDPPGLQASIVTLHGYMLSL